MRMRFERTHHRTRKRIADDEYPGRGMALGLRPELERIESLGWQKNDRPTTDEFGHGAVEPSAMHQWTGGNDAARHWIGANPCDVFFHVSDEGIDSGRFELNGTGITTAPHHSFRPAGGASGIQEVSIIRRADDSQRTPVSGGGEFLVNRTHCRHSRADSNPQTQITRRPEQWR